MENDYLFFTEMAGDVFYNLAVEFGAAVGQDGRHYAFSDYPEYHVSPKKILYQDGVGDLVVRNECDVKTVTALCAEDNREYLLEFPEYASEETEVIGNEYGGNAVFVSKAKPYVCVC